MELVLDVLQLAVLFLIVFINLATLRIMERIVTHKKLYDRVVDAVVKELLPKWRKENQGKEDN